MILSLTGGVIAAAMSTRALVAKSIDDRLAHANPTNGICRFVNYAANAANGVFELNTNFWARGIDFSCASPWNDQSGAFRAGTLISKRHIIFAKHYPLATGSRIVFVGEDGGVCACRLVAQKDIGDRSDIKIGLLDYEVTDNVKPAKILPVDAERKLGDCSWLPIAMFNRKEHLTVISLAPFPSANGASPGIGCRTSRERSRVLFEEKVEMGDSGNPAFMVMGKQAILLFCIYGGGCGCGTAVHLCADKIQRTMDELCPGYKLERFDFSNVEYGK